MLVIMHIPNRRPEIKYHMLVQVYLSRAFIVTVHIYIVPMLYYITYIRALAPG